jgi:8-amino-7-oxononanoate synthase
LSTRDAPLAWIDDELDRLDGENLRRRLIVREGPQAATICVGGREYINFAANDYLALAGDVRLAKAAQQTIAEEGWGAGASPLIVGRSAAHARLEQRLAEFEGTEAALVFPSGYAANVGAICALAGRGDAVFSDELNHASIVDGCRLSRADVYVYPHGDCRALEEQLRKAAHVGESLPDSHWRPGETRPREETRRRKRRRLIVTDSLFSMHGDLAPLPELARLAAAYDCMLLIDEAHATGVLGRQGRGVAELLDVEDRVHARVGTLSKALGCHGGFVCGSRRLIDWLVNRARPYVFSTAGPPAGAAAAVAALDVVASEPHRRTRLLEMAADSRHRLRQQGWDTGRSESQIVPVFVGDSAAALRLAAELREAGFWAPPIRPPTVPPGQSCLRVSLSYAHKPEMIERLCEKLRSLK